MSVIDLDAGSVAKSIQVGPHLSHPEGMAVDPTAPRAFVANANQDTIAVIDTDSMSVERTLSVEGPQGTGTTPTQLSVTPTAATCCRPTRGRTRSRSSPFRRGGCDGSKSQGHGNGQPARQPFESWPAPGGLLSDDGGENAPGQLAWISARGLGVGPNPNGPNPPTERQRRLHQQLPIPALDRAGLRDPRFPTDRTIRKLSPAADRQIVPINSQARRRARRSARTGRSSTCSTSSRRTAPTTRSSATTPAATATRALTLFGDQGHPERARLGQALPAARPRLRELRGLDRRPLLDRRRRRVRLRGQELDPELRGAAATLRLRRVRVSYAAEGSSSTRPTRGHLLLQLRRGPRRARRRCPTRTATPRRRQREPHSR